MECILTGQQPPTGVISFKDRTGIVVPQNGDYTAEMVGAMPIVLDGVTGQVLTKTIDGQIWQDLPKLGDISTEQTITLSSSSWTSTSGVYQQTATVTGITPGTPVIIVNPVLSATDADANNTIIEAWGKISKLEISQGANSLTFRAAESLSVNIPLKVGVC